MSVATKGLGGQRTASVSVIDHDEKFEGVVLELDWEGARAIKS